MLGGVGGRVGVIWGIFFGPFLSGIILACLGCVLMGGKGGVFVPRGPREMGGFVEVLVVVCCGLGGEFRGECSG